MNLCKQESYQEQESILERQKRIRRKKIRLRTPLKHSSGIGVEKSEILGREIRDQKWFKFRMCDFISLWGKCLNS